MFKTIEAEVLEKRPSPTLQLELAQHDFERLKLFCLLIYIAIITLGTRPLIEGLSTDLHPSGVILTTLTFHTPA
ncbi:hypothetical protein [Pseudomonas canadensis]|jgi:hypothetical protein|uniref:hypothetical protein n=1 Tax=Pseudomonas canadensis TaxID=915099 RepID=UPI0028934FC3|nr:hypothetical protein [Pseudomonas canadensis]WNJ82353.1 hypothetical protein RMQ99_14580 [Pseudomonas canadensis]